MFWKDDSAWRYLWTELEEGMDRTGAVNTGPVEAVHRAAAAVWWWGRGEEGCCRLQELEAVHRAAAAVWWWGRGEEGYCRLQELEWTELVE